MIVQSSMLSLPTLLSGLSLAVLLWCRRGVRVQSMLSLTTLLSGLPGSVTVV